MLSESPIPIAIVGMSCRLSGDVSNPEDLWTMISRGRDGWGPIPKDRFNADAYYHPNPQKAGCFNQKGGYFMRHHDLSKFDAPFFRITKQEAMGMDPQQRQLLECTYEALENAGLPRESMAGRQMGVFVGTRPSDYRLGALKDMNSLEMFDFTGNHQSIQPGRISYYFDLRGPCFAVDTACSSSLYALHSAVQSIRSGESESAIVVAGNLNLQPDETVSMSMIGLFNDEGKTFAFDHRAQGGFARGEGVACLVIKPLDQALKDNDKIRSVIVNTGTGQDGKSVGMTTPSGEAQEQLIRDVYSRAGISPEDTGFFEAHGTGTKVGDPIEAGAIHRVFSPGRTKRAPLYLGSVKSNVGHLENASGIISVIKATLMLEKGFILPNANFEKPNPAIPLDEWKLKVPINTRPWPKNKKYISVNNFGFGGSNAHAVLEAAPQPLSLAELGQQLQQSDVESPKLFVISGNDEGTAKRVASQIGIYVEQHPEIFQKRRLTDMAYTLGERRTHFPWRIGVAASSCDELAMSFNSSATIPIRASTTGVPPKLAFVFTGQGAQWPRMGQELMDTHPVFAATLKAAAACLERLGAPFDLLQELSKSKEESIVGHAHISQPICTAIQLGLTALLSSWGIHPSMVIGHSSGEICAAYAAGGITLEDAMTVAYERGQVAALVGTKHTELHGAMLAVGAGPDEAKKTIKQLGLVGSVTVACENSPISVTVSGDETSIDMVVQHLEKQNTFNRKLRVGVAYHHSGHMNLVQEAYMASIQQIAASKPTGDGSVAFYSSLLGKRRSQEGAFDPSYWVENLTKPVLFSSAMQELCMEGRPDIIIEVGPHSALEGPIKQIMRTVGGSQQSTSGPKYIPSLVRNQHATVTMLKLAGGLFTHGHDLNFSAINQTDTSTTGHRKPVLITDFPPYPWSDYKYWSEPRTGKQHRLKPFARHDLLGTLEDAYSEAEPTWRNVISTDDIPWLKDHRMQSLITFPLAGYISMIIEAVSQRAQLRGITKEQIAGYRLREIQASKALIMADGAQYEMVVSLRAYAEGTRSYSSEWDEGWLEHCRGLVGVKKANQPTPVITLEQQQEVNARHKEQFAKSLLDSQPVPVETFYSELEERGAGYASTFTLPRDGGLVRTSSKDYSRCNVAVPDTSAVMPKAYETPSILPAAFADLFFQVIFPLLGAGMGEMPTLFMPSAVSEMDIGHTIPNRPGEKLQVVAHGYRDPSTAGSVDFSIHAWQGDEVEPVVKISGFRMTPVNNSDVNERQAPRPLCYKLQWQPLDDQTNSSKHPNTVLVTDRDKSDPLINALARLLRSTTGKDAQISPLESLTPDPSSHYIFLEELDAPVLLNAKAPTFERIQKLLLECSAMLWVTMGAYVFAHHPENNMVQGLLRTIRSETGKHAASLDLDPKSELDVAGRAKLIVDALGASLPSRSDEDGSGIMAEVIPECEFAEEHGKLVVPRIVVQEDMNLALFRETSTETPPPYLQDFEQPGRRLKLVVGTLGALDSLYWTDEPELPLEDDQIEIRIAATGMNFKDVVIAMGQVASPYIGIECSGVVARVGAKVDSVRLGDRVCAMPLGAYGTFARCKVTSAALIPESMSFELAASLPVVYSTAYYGLMDLARMQPGETILIHAASGGVGQAAIQIAQRVVGASAIYATVGSAEKKKLLMDIYAIPEQHIFYSRNTDFGSAVRAATEGKGVDVVLNSLAGDLLRESWESLAPFGRFVEIGKRDITSNTRLEMAKFEQNCTFSSVDLTLVAAERPKIMNRVLSAVMALIRYNVIQPIGPISTVGLTEVESALRRLQSGKTSGKLIVSHFLPNQQVKATHRTMTTTVVRGDATYIIIGGTGGIGRSLARRMVRRGARHIVLLSRRDTVTAELAQLMEESKLEHGASIYVMGCDAAVETQVNGLMAEIENAGMPPIRGIIHAAMVLKDVLFEKMTFSDFDTVVRSKVQGALNFHKALANHPADFFVLLSSVAGIVGNKGQAAYAAANTFLDALAAHRRQQGQAAVSLNLAAIEGVGYLAENAAKQAQVLRCISGSTMNEPELLTLIEAAIEGKVSSLCGDQCITGLDISDPANLPYYCEADARFSILREAAMAKVAGDVGSSSEVADLPVSQKLRRAASADDALDIVTDGLLDKLAAILMLPVEALTAQKATSSLTDFGLDSLTAIELRNWIGKELQAHLQVLELLTSGRLRDVAALVLKKTRLEGVWSKPVEGERGSG
ncbi:polyketide synthase [Podospora didyma]|uniref:Polyketide synthase n=1 Tax=Podospora didyma TaxID=330526 RepID=A0AAE0NR69_9PEZI|nr:polyketide synthase [Podospora didyma]